MTERELMKDWDGEKHGNRFCKKNGCGQCDGTDENGEPNGYGCPAQEQYVQKRYDSLLKRRMKRHSLTTDEADATHGLSWR